MYVSLDIFVSTPMDGFFLMKIGRFVRSDLGPRQASVKYGRSSDRGGRDRSRDRDRRRSRSRSRDRRDSRRYDDRDRRHGDRERRGSYDRYEGRSSRR